MIEAVVLWNEPNNLSHWNFHLDPDWERFTEMVKAAPTRSARVNPDLPIVLGGVSVVRLRLPAADGLARASWNMWMWSASTGFRWIGIIGRSRSGRTGSRKPREVTGKPVWVT